MSTCKLCRRENVKLFLKGDRCVSDKCSFERRPYPPGQHGQSRLKFSEYALQLREKQKTKRFYGLDERQFRRYFAVADQMKGKTGEQLLALLETRLDNVVYHLGFAVSRREARTMISHGHVCVNSRPVNIPSYSLSKADVVTIIEKSREISRLALAVDSAGKRTVPDWLESDLKEFRGVVKDIPTRDQISVPVEENMIVEYYSR